MKKEEIFWKNIELKLGVASKFIAILVGISYALGFVIWNIYLQSLGFYPDIFQGRFVLTGLLYIFTLMVFMGLINLVYTFLKKIPCTWFQGCILFKTNDDISWVSRKTGYTVFLIIYTLFFSFFIFPQFQGWAGGAKPKLISIIGDEQNIAYLKNFGIGSASVTQTGILCSVYDGNNYLIVILDDRILSLKKDIYKGFGSLPNADSDKFTNECNITVISNLMEWRKLNIEKPQ